MNAQLEQVNNTHRRPHTYNPQPAALRFAANTAPATMPDDEILAMADWYEAQEYGRYTLESDALDHGWTLSNET